MKQEQKELLLKDLCARLPYGVKVKVKYYDNIWDLLAIYTNGTTYTIRDVGYPIETYFEDCKPYLFPLSSMTEEQEEELKNIYYSFNGMFQYTERIFDKIPFSKMKYFPYQIEEFFNRNQFDYRGLIPMGLAIDASGKNIY